MRSINKCNAQVIMKENVLQNISRKNKRRQKTSVTEIMSSSFEQGDSEVKKEF